MLAPPHGLHFRKLDLLRRHEDLRWTTELVVGCSHTPEHLDVACLQPGAAIFVPEWTRSLLSAVGGTNPASIDLSKATKLREAVFRPESLIADWIPMALQPSHQDMEISDRFRFMCYHSAIASVDADIRQTVGEQIFGSSPGPSLGVVFDSPGGDVHENVEGKQEFRESAERLSPEITKRGVINPSVSPATIVTSRC